MGRNVDVDAIRSSFQKEMLRVVNEERNKQLEQQAKKRLEDAIKISRDGLLEQSKSSVFQDVIVSAVLGREWLQSSDGAGQDKKALVGMSLLKDLKR